MFKLPTLGEMDRTLAVKVYLATGATDMRKGFDSLAALVREHLGHDPLSGCLFLFIGRDRDRIKILAWGRDTGTDVIRGRNCLPSHGHL